MDLRHAEQIQVTLVQRVFFHHYWEKADAQAGTKVAGMGNDPDSAHGPSQSVRSFFQESSRGERACLDGVIPPRCQRNSGSGQQVIPPLPVVIRDAREIVTESGKQDR